ncbi:SRPBCC family protein [Streptomyces sp. MAA16]|uniref:SRPBCC family protein n=1 Tax=Streptomyces sp. MAA16 TaxID=3035116 RepID=UPI002475373F|nr:SRPBCC family protein [Streptomyces sp. MAA16]MDH6702762.1 carbon monoxide dehydrogenase subunit G [Streptomyces sp. MAA16]
MEHEVFVPVPAARLRDALADPARVARAIPGLHQDAGAEPGTGRLKVRVGGHSVTCRGTLRVSAGEDGTHLVTGDATEARGSGTVRLTLTVRVRDTDGGATVSFTGTASADGRLADLPQDAVASAATRLLDRFAANLGATPDEATPDEAVRDEATPDEAAEDEPGEEPGAAPGEAPGEPGSDADASNEDAADVSDASSEDAASASDASSEDAADASNAPDVSDASDAPDAPDASDAPADSDPVDAIEGADAVPPVVPLVPVEPIAPEEPPAEAAHARRTMIGRSAEEVDHAPPRGRYAPVPAPQTIAPGSPLRWAAPAAAVALASAIVVTRALRRRR